MLREIRLDPDTDVRQALEAAVAELTAGRLVIAPDESGWILLGLSTSEVASTALAQFSEQLTERAEAVVGFAHPEVVSDYLAEAPRLFRKLSGRCWPGPVVLRVDSRYRSGLEQKWARSAQDWAVTDSGCAFYCPADHFTSRLLSQLPAPVLGLIGAESFPLPYSECGPELGLHVRPESSRYTDPPTRVRIDPDQLQIEQAGVVSERMLQRLSGDIYLFVCTGNTCRSPMAEMLFRKMLTDRLKCREDELMDHGFMVVSAGLAASRGAPASPEAVELLRKHDEIDLGSHESQPVTEELLFHSDRIITMTHGHRDALTAAYPELAAQIQLLSPDMRDISDPIGAGREEYARCRDEIVSCLNRLLDEIDFHSTEGDDS